MKKLVVLGGGESGTGAAILGLQKGYQVWLSDKGKIEEKYKKVLIDNEIEIEEGQHSENIILQADVVVKSPGIPDSIKLIEKIKSKGIPVISEIEFAAQYTDAKLICITGSNGKTTTTSLLYFILKNAGLNVGLGGNIGKSFAWSVAEDDFETYVLEISSFQLDGMFEFKADIAIITNITPDHLDRYDDCFQNYVDSKMRIIQNMDSSDYLIYNADDAVITAELNKKKSNIQLLPFSLYEKFENGAWMSGDNVIIKNQKDELIMTLRSLALQGKHNTYNSMAAGIASKLMNIRNKNLKESLEEFQTLPHRMESVATIGGVQYINDSKSTNVNSTYFALDSVNRPIIWIAGGKDKGNDYESIKNLVNSKVKAIVCLGLDNISIHENFGKFTSTIIDTYSAQEAVETAQRLAEAGDAVLLSPACASFDLFENFEDRGDKFKKAVNEL
ncbi:UDP-N-acetylmuramoyl-L-alanine--D-glutamate ligase [Lentimicrobium sp. S6]|uniref:UDP-N-acetylmuramoyl-L-alanine--D-glutamate ligase n=1 Tax=Lentimicrobium sp. S6 TaxID=2735872 RepID=UPI001555B3A8|nr:UDP-N-acetylmuramoyl-L-alanine--D-glutamate ligase [Lentimicrobium sp. S6]NPD44321.1 UDP-N-acetylmuramoyl-L-alanine--D-glutamate ligase [Lentimicrobium sp. S6]